MLVRDWMTSNVISLGVNSSVMDAAEILHDKNIRQFPVIDRHATLVGIVSDRDIRDAMPSKFIPGDNADGRGGGLYTLTAEDIMTLDPITVTSDTAVNEVAELFVKHKVGGLPVVDGGQLCGIITQADVMRFLCASSGTMRSEVQLAVNLEAKAAPLAALLCDLRDMQLAFSSVFTANDTVHTTRRNAYLRIESLGDLSVEEVVKQLQKKYKVLYYVNEGITVDVS